MRHHLDRAKFVYKERGLTSLLTTVVKYAPIEVNNLIFRLTHGSGCHVMKENWDTLILLDACRYDVFSEVIEQTDLGGELNSRISLGSTSEEFLQRNFARGTFHDTVYVNTNPYLPQLNLDTGTFHSVIDLLTKWDEDSQTIHPETVVSAALDAHDEFQNKRIIVHFMQPHVPFIGDLGDEISAKGWTVIPGDAGGQGTNDRTVWQRLRDRSTGDGLDEKLVWEAYRENLEVVLSHVTTLVDALDGKIVLSSDHGNLAGERLTPLPTRRMYGHYYGVYTEELVKVPWYVIETGHRRDITDDLPVEQASSSAEIVEDRLSALGYQ